MKKSLQLVALVIVALLAMQPALANVCAQGDPQPMESHDCCAGSGAASAHQDLTGGIPPSQMLSDCNAGCCTVSPQNAPVPDPSEKAKADPVPVTQDNQTTMALPIPQARPLALDVRHNSDTARYILLKVFRI
jgi:hypothetical protein